MLLIVITFVIAVLYVFLIILFIVGWRRVPLFVPNGNEKITKLISIVLACRDEEENILQFISAIAQQSYQNYELILVNDHSHDGTRENILNAQTSLPNITLIDAIGFGKKNAIKEGVLRATSDFIVTTDADCVPSFHWLETLVCFNKEFPSDLIISPVRLSYDTYFFPHLQAIEFSSLVAAGAGAAGLNKSILCNAANMAFSKRAWLKSSADLHEDEISGDDIFLLQSIKKRNGVIRFLKSESAFVTAQPARTLHEFIYQRRRWASKSPSYTDWHIIFTAVLILGISLWQFFLLFLSFGNQLALELFSVLFLVKFLADNIFLLKIRKLFHLFYTGIYSIPLSILYPFYIVFVGITALIIKPKKWK